MRAIITTTINVPHSLRDWRHSLDVAGDGTDMIFIAGDYKSPHNEIEDFLDTLPGGKYLNRYLRPEAQAEWHVSEAIGWNSIQRRNIALLEALKHGVDTITTVDDDNLVIIPEHMTQVIDTIEGRRPVSRIVKGTDGWFNVAKIIGVHHRGYPLARRNDNGEIESMVDAPERLRVGVHASFWIGSPDVDAIERIAHDPIIEEYTHSDRTTALALGTWCPFNSQATTYIRKLAPLMLVWPGVGRFDDIWASYLARRVMDAFGYVAVYGGPFVRQDRNEHNLLADLRAELHGYEYTEQLCELLRSIDLHDANDIVEAMRLCFAELVKMSYIPTQTVETFRAWDRDIEDLITTFGVDFS